MIIEINDFLGNIIKFLAVFINKIDHYKFNKDDHLFDAEDFIEDRKEDSVLTTLIYLAVIPLALLFIIYITASNILMFTVRYFIAPYIGKVVLYIIKILALITAILLVYYILVKLSKVNTFIDKNYINFFIKTFQNFIKI